MADLIDKQTAIDAICKKWCYCDSKHCVHSERYCDGCDDADIIASLPSVTPQIILCKDCNEWHRGKDRDRTDIYSDEGFCSVHRIVTGENYYCGDAERR